MDHLGQLTAERARDPPLELLVRTMVGAADHVRDPEVEVVGDGRELVRRRPVRTEQRHAAEAERAVRVPLGPAVASARSAAAAYSSPRSL